MVPPVEYCLKDHELSSVIVKRICPPDMQPGPGNLWLGSSLFCGLLQNGSQTVRVTESKCLQLAFNRAGAARKGIGRRSPRTENRSSQVSVADGRREPNPEGSLHYCLLLSDGDINNRGEDVEEFNTLVCRPCYIVMRGQCRQTRACANADFF